MRNDGFVRCVLGIYARSARKRDGADRIAAEDEDVWTAGFADGCVSMVSSPLDYVC